MRSITEPKLEIAQMLRKAAADIEAGTVSPISACVILMPPDQSFVEYTMAFNDGQNRLVPLIGCLNIYAHQTLARVFGDQSHGFSRRPHE